MTLAKGLAGGVPIGAVVTFGDEVSGLLGAGQHGTTFGGNPLACAAALAVLDTIERDGLLEQVKATGEHLVEAVEGLGHPLVREVRGAGLLRAIALTRDVSAQVTADLEARGPIVNPVRPDTIRLAPPLVLTTDEVDEFVADLSVVLDGIVASEGGTP
jgi:acetylornithine aminotransferase